MIAAVGNTYLSDLMADWHDSFEKYVQREKYFDDVALWAKDVLGVRLWWKQNEICIDIATGGKKSIAVRAGHGVGKTFLAAVVACWWIDTRPIQRVFLASTAPSADQVHTLLWRYIRNFWSISHERYIEFKRLTALNQSTGDMPDHALPGYITQTSIWKDDLGNIIGQGRKPPDAKEDSFQGIHAEYVLAVGDEACGLQEQMIDSLSNITSNTKSRRLLIGNPTNPRTRFGAIFNDTTPRLVDLVDDLGRPVLGDDGKVEKVVKTLQDVWSLHHISVLDSPNFHGGGRCLCHPDEPLGLGLDQIALDSLSDQSYVDEKTAEYGVESARFKARVQGEFAYDSGNALFDAYDIAKAIDAAAYIDYSTLATTTVLGVDVARSADGDTTYVYRFTTGLMYDWADREVDGPNGEKVTEFARVGVGVRAGGELRFVDSYRGVPLVDRFERDGTRTVGQATLVHQHAIDLHAVELRVDSGGMGVGFIDGLWAHNWNERLDQPFYDIIEMQGGGPTPDGRFWINNRAFQLDQMKKRFHEGLIDLDPADRVLKEQLEDILYEFVDPHGAMKIESKESMRKRGMKSPDAADAAWYACADVTHLRAIQPGDIVRKNPDEVLNGREEELIASGYREMNPW